MRRTAPEKRSVRGRKEGIVFEQELGDGELEHGASYRGAALSLFVVEVHDSTVRKSGCT